jgi:Fe2+ transport system protein B
MDLIEAGFGWLANTVKAILPAGALADLLTDGVIGGVSARPSSSSPRSACSSF